MEEDVKFNLNSIEETFANYKKNNIYDGVVVAKNENGVIFNIGGKSDAFIAKHDFKNYNDVKIGDRFKALVLGTKTEDGMIEVSQEQAEEIINSDRYQILKKSFQDRKPSEDLCKSCTYKDRKYQ